MESFPRRGATRRDATRFIGRLALRMLKRVLGARTRVLAARNIFNARDNPARRIVLRDAKVPSELRNLPARFLDRAEREGGR